jgi:hypothetical protein
VCGKATKDELIMGDDGFVRHILLLVLPYLNNLVTNFVAFLKNRTLKPGVNYGGYWTGNHVLIQTDDMMDYTRVIFPQQFEQLCLYNHIFRKEQLMVWMKES